MNPAIAGVIGIWLVSLLIGAISWEKSNKGRLRRTDIFVVMVSVIAGGIWMFALIPRTTAARTAAGRARTATGTCAMIEVGQSAGEVEARLGKPDEIRSEEETRGPEAKVWIYRDSRCAIHFFGDEVELIE